MSKINYEPRKKTDDGAKKIVKILFNHPCALVNVGTGGGKTFMSIRAAGAWKPNAHLIVFTTKNQVNSQSWHESIESYNQNVKKAHLTYDVFNYEALRENLKKQHAYLNSLHKNKKIHDVFIIVDEAHRIKDPTSKTFKMIKRFANLPENKGIMLLTATPFSNGPLDAASYLILAHYYKNKTQFYNAHVTRYDDFFKPKIKDYDGNIRLDWIKHPEYIINRLKTIMVNVDTSGLLPPVKFKTFEFKMTAQEYKGYRKIAKGYKDGIYDSIPEVIKIQNEFVAHHNQQRLRKLKTLLDCPRQPGPVIIFYSFNADRDELRKNLPKLFPKYQIIEANGEHSFDPNIDYQDQSIILAQYKALGEGVNIPQSHMTIFYSPTASWQEYKQGKGRNVRAYQKGTTYQARFVVQGTINEHYWYDLLDKKKSFTKKFQKFLVQSDLVTPADLFD